MRGKDLLRWVGRNGRRVAVTVIGFVLVLAGLVMLVTPGPGLGALIAGLAVLATEYAWARRALEQARRRARLARSKIRRNRRRRKEARATSRRSEERRGDERRRGKSPRGKSPAGEKRRDNRRRGERRRDDRRGGQRRRGGRSGS